ncbi:MAG: hypothetical protein ABIL58_18260 [Pseudomonadota bacterium]
MKLQKTFTIFLILLVFQLSNLFLLKYKPEHKKFGNKNISLGANESSSGNGTGPKVPTNRGGPKLGPGGG